MSDSLPVNINANVDVKIDGTPALTETAKGIRSGCGTILQTLLGGHLAKINSQSIREKAQAETDAILISKGLARLDEKGKLAFIAPPEACAQFLMEARQQQYQANLAGCLEQAQIALEASSQEIPSEPSIDPDVLGVWQDHAEKITGEYLQKLWGRILKEEIQKPGSFPVRVLNVIRNLSMEEAEIFTRVARTSLSGILLSDKKVACLTEEEVAVLHDAGLITTILDMIDKFVPRDKVAVFNAIDCHIACHFSSLPKEIHLPGFTLTPTGKRLLAIPEIEPITPASLEKIFALVKLYNPTLEKITVHPLIEPELIELSICLAQFPSN